MQPKLNLIHHRGFLQILRNFQCKWQSEQLLPAASEVSWDIFLRILTGRKYHQIKLRHLEKVRTWAFGLLVHRINSL